MCFFCIQYILLSYRDKGGMGCSHARCGHCHRNGLNNPITSVVVTAGSKHILIHHSREVSSLGRQAHQLSSYTDSKMAYTGLAICWLEKPLWLFLFPVLTVWICYNEGADKFFWYRLFLCHTLTLCPCLSPCRISDNATKQVRDFSSLPSSSNLAFSFPLHFLPAIGPARTKLLTCILMWVKYFSPLGLKLNGLQFGRFSLVLRKLMTKMLLQSYTCTWTWWEGFFGGW